MHASQSSRDLCTAVGESAAFTCFTAYPRIPSVGRCRGVRIEGISRIEGSGNQILERKFVLERSQSINSPLSPSKFLSALTNMRSISSVWLLVLVTIFSASATPLDRNDETSVNNYNSSRRLFARGCHTCCCHHFACCVFCSHCYSTFLCKHNNQNC